MKTRFRRSLAAASTSAVLLLGATALPANAQEGTPPPPPAAADVDESTLRAFAHASVEVDELAMKWAPRIEQAEDDAQAEELRESANAEMAAAVQSSGIDLQTYNQIFNAAQADPELATTIQQYREQAQ